MGEKKYDLLTLGEILLRLSPSDGGRLMRASSLDIHVGGAELNVAAGAAQLGLRTGIISRIPESEIGLLVRSEIRRQGVDDRYLLADRAKDARLGLYYYERAAAPGKPRVVYDRRGTSVYGLREEEFPAEMFSGTRCFHTCGITLALDQQVRKTAVSLMKRFKEAGALISFDVNFRGNLWTGPEAKECIERILPYVDIFFCSEETAKLTFLKEGDVYQIMRSFAKEYPLSIVASTQRIVHSPKVHTFGSVIYNAKEDKFYQEEPYRNIEVVDRIGSGDAYISGALYGLLAHDFDCQKALEYGNATSSVKNTIPGDLPSCGLEEIDRIIKNHKNTGIQLEMDR